MAIGDEFPGSMPLIMEGVEGLDQQTTQHGADEELAEHEAAGSADTLGQLTDTTRAGFVAMSTRRENIHSKIEEMLAAGVAFLDQTKAEFVASMERIKEQLDDYCNVTVEGWSKSSEETFEAHHRLQAAKQLVQSLGLEAIPK